MKEINIRGVNINVTPALEAAVEKAAVGVMKMKDENSSVFVKMKVDGKMRHKAEVTAICKKKTLRVEKETKDMYSAVTEAFNVLEHKMAKFNDKVTNRKKESIKVAGLVDEDYDVDDIEIVVHKGFPAKPMSPEEACAEMNLLDHDFFVFVNSETENVEVVYKRDDGKYGLIALETNK